MSKGPTTIPDDAAALVLRENGEIELHFPEGSLDGDDEPAPEHCLLIAALGAACMIKPEVIREIIEQFASDHGMSEDRSS